MQGNACATRWVFGARDRAHRVKMRGFPRGFLRSRTIRERRAAGRPPRDRGSVSYQTPLARSRNGLCVRWIVSERGVRDEVRSRDASRHEWTDAPLRIDGNDARDQSSARV